jgi:hypothetical protein
MSAFCLGNFIYRLFILVGWAKFAHPTITFIHQLDRQFAQNLEYLSFFYYKYNTNQFDKYLSLSIYQN